MTDPTHDPRLLSRAAGPGRVRGITLDVWTEAAARPLGAAGRFRRAARESRALHSRERRLASEAWHQLPRLGPRLVWQRGVPIDLALDPGTTVLLRWLAWLVHLGLPEAEAEAAWAAAPELRDPRLADSAWPTIQHTGPPPAAVLLGVPHDVAAPLAERLGDQLTAFDAAFGPRPAVDLRVNLARSSRQAVLDTLQRRGIDAQPTPASAVGVRVPPKTDLRATGVLQQGLVELQDEASQLIAATVDLPPGGTVLDLCAGAGGKTLAMADRVARQTGRRTRLFATDVRERPLGELRKRLQRAGVQGVHTAVLPKLPASWPARFDRVLVDAPCSGAGIWRRHPTYRWRTHTLQDTMDLQDRVLDDAIGKLAPGGRLIYATCSVLPQEDEDRVRAALQRHPHLRPGPLDDLPATMRDGPAVRTWPHRDGCDGFFGIALDALG